MPVRSSNSSVLRWPDAKAVDAACRRVAERAARERPEVVRIGYGSYARGDWGVGSDLDMIVVVTDAEEPFSARGCSWDLSEIPVPAQVLVYTEHEWESLRAEGGRFATTIEREAVWLIDRAPRHPALGSGERKPT